MWDYSICGSVVMQQLQLHVSLQDKDDEFRRDEQITFISKNHLHLWAAYKL